MPREFQRKERVGDFIQQQLALVIQRELRDPRVGMVDVTGVEVSRDIAYARVFVTFLGIGSEAEAKAPLKALNHAAGFLRSEIAKSNNMRSTPKLQFEYDSSVQRGSELTQLIEDAVADDESRHSAATGEGNDAADAGTDISARGDERA